MDAHSARSISWLKYILFLVLALVFMATAASPAVAQDNWEIYRHAINDASVYSRNKVLPLRPPPAENGRVLVVTYTNYAYPDPPYPKPYHIPDKVYIWVTGDGEVRNTCKQFHLSGDQLRLRLDQLLGLRPDTNYTVFVVLSVPADRIFRPTPDPNPTTVLPCSNPIDPQCGNTFPSDVPVDYFAWFVKQATSSYRVGQTLAEDGYPWTHLGYTYDWAPYAASKYGASEYVIMPNTEATIVNKFTMDDYCNAP